MRAGITLAAMILLSSLTSRGQEILLMDRFDGNKVVNDSVLTIFSSDTNIIDLTKYFVMVNNTDRTLALFLRKTVHAMADSTTDYFCFGPKCWADTDTTNMPDSLHPGVEDFTFASHVVHVRRFDLPPLPPGFTSITYTVFDNTTFPEPIEASVTVNYHLSPLSIREQERIPVTVFPNPARDWITVSTDELLSDDLKIIICNGTGEVVMDKEAGIHNRPITIPVRGLVPGIYHGRLIQGNNQAAGFSFIVVR